MMQQTKQPRAIGRHRRGDAILRNWDVRLLAVGLVGALAGTLYSMFPIAGGSLIPDEYLLLVNSEVSDVEALSKETLANIAVAAKRRDGEYPD
jgi:hypothetical protein